MGSAKEYEKVHVEHFKRKFSEIRTYKPSSRRSKLENVNEDKDFRFEKDMMFGSSSESSSDSEDEVEDENMLEGRGGEQSGRQIVGSSEGRGGEQSGRQVVDSSEDPQQSSSVNGPSLEDGSSSHEDEEDEEEDRGER